MESIKIEGVEQHTGVYVGIVNNGVWVNVLVKNGNANLCITPENAERLIEALRVAIVEASNEG